MPQYYVYSIGDSRRGLYDSCILWWKENGHGYTADLAKAGLFTDEDKSRNYPPHKHYEEKNCVYVPREVAEASVSKIRPVYIEDLERNLSECNS